MGLGVGYDTLRSGDWILRWITLMIVHRGEGVWIIKIALDGVSSAGGAGEARWVVKFAVGSGKKMGKRDG